MTTGKTPAATTSASTVQLVTLFKQGRYAEAERLARELTQNSPELGFGWKALGAIMQLQKRTAESLEYMRHAAQLLPLDAEAQYNLGVTLMELDRTMEAKECYLRTLQLKPDYVDAHINLGFILNQLVCLEEAKECYLRAIEINPGLAEAHNNLGNTFKGLGRLKEAEASYRRALEIKQDYVEAHNNLGNIFNDLCRLEEAEAHYLCALRIKPDYAEAYCNLGITLKLQGRLEKAEARIRHALEIRPNFAKAYNVLGSILKDLNRLEEAEACYCRALQINPDYSVAYSNWLFCLNYSDCHDHMYKLEEARKYGEIVVKNVRQRFSDWQCSPRPERLRVGLASGDFCNHPVGYFLESLLARLDRTRVELVAFPTYARTDELTCRIKPYFSAWQPLYGLNDEAAARLIHSQGIHILLDLSGHTAHNRLPVFAWKPAPVQVSWLGYVATTGVAEMDYLLSDKVRVPEAHQGHFTEQIWYLPDTRLCFSPPAIDLPVQPLPALANGFVTFACFQTLAKVSDSMLQAWGSIMAALPTARLRLQSKQLADHSARRSIADRLQQSGINPSRVTMYGPASRKIYLEAYAEVDMNLDTFPFPGVTTTCEALWSGVPTVTMAGSNMAARSGASVMTAAGLADWVATSQEDYVTKAVTMARDLPRLAALRAGLRAQVMASPLFDATRFARNFEAALWGMWQQHVNQSPAEPIL